MVEHVTTFSFDVDHLHWSGRGKELDTEANNYFEKSLFKMASVIDERLGETEVVLLLFDCL